MCVRTGVPEKVKVAAIKIEFHFKQLFHRIAGKVSARACVLLHWAHMRNILPDYFLLLHIDWHIQKRVVAQSACSSCTSYSFFYRWNREVYANGRYRMYLSVYASQIKCISMANTHRLLVNRKPVYSEYSIAISLFLGFFLVLIFLFWCSLFTFLIYVLTAMWNIDPKVEFFLPSNSFSHKHSL